MLLWAETVYKRTREIYDKCKNIRYNMAIKGIKKAASGIDDQANAYVNMHRAILNLYKMKQGTNEANNHFLD